MPVLTDLPGRRSAGETVQDALSGVLTYVVNPLVLPPIVIGLLLRSASTNTREVGGAVAISVAVFVIGPLVLASRAIRRGASESLELPDRETRRKMLPSAAIIVIVGAVASRPWSIEGGGILAWVYAAYAVGAISLIPLYRRSKISIHAAGLGSAASMLALASVMVSTSPCVPVVAPIPSPVLAAGVFLAIPIVGWARVRRRAHSWSEIAAGFLLGVSVPTLIWIVWSQMGVPVAFCAPGS